MAFEQHSLKGYNSSGEWQLDITLNLVENFTQTLRESSEDQDSWLNIADYGCSEGLNSMIFFEKCIRNLRETSHKELFIVHTDLPENNWPELNNLFITSPDSYLTLPNTHYSTIGRSFFQQLFPANSIHVGFSSFAFHYLSKKPVRKEGDTAMIHQGFIEQALSDVRTILRHRITELRQNGTLTILSATSGDQINMNLGKLQIIPFIALMNRGIIVEEKLKKMEWNIYAMKLDEWRGILEEFKDEIEVIKLESNKYVCPFYKKYLEDGNLEEYQDSLAKFITTLARVMLFSILDCDDEGKENAFRIFVEETKKAISENIAEIYMDVATVIIKKR